MYHELYNTIVDNLGDPLSEDKEAEKELEDYIAGLKLFCLNDSLDGRRTQRHSWTNIRDMHAESLYSVPLIQDL